MAREVEGVAGAASGALRVAAATAAFALVHSALATRGVKAAARRALGPRAADGWYRPLYNAQALATFAALAAYTLRQPRRELYAVRGAAAGLMRAGQLAAAAYAGWAVASVGVAEFAGVPGFAAWSRGAAALPPSPEAQGPGVDDTGRLRAGGPFALSRHPLNVAFGLVLWLQPRVTSAFAALAAVSTVYLVAGSHHEEARLAARLGAVYDAYRRGGTPFFLPAPPLRPGAGPALAPHDA